MIGDSVVGGTRDHSIIVGRCDGLNPESGQSRWCGFSSVTEGKVINKNRKYRESYGIWLLTFQTMLGRGFPSARQKKEIVPPARTVEGSGRTIRRAGSEPRH